MTDGEPFWEGVAGYYTAKLREHGAGHRGVDWNSAESQALRFEQLLKVVDPTRPFALTDFGCGYGALVEHLGARGWAFDYTGFDISAAQVAEARRAHGTRPGCRFTDAPADLGRTDYVVASGVFNVTLGADAGAWSAYVLRTLDRFDGLAGRGFAFNALTRYSDADRMRPDLFYADPCLLFDHCKRRYARDVALLHDYGLYEFTILVRK
jgi:SAM-dependent methyltransferase